MTKTEALMLVRLVKGICPAQQIDTYTPDAWYEVLQDIRFEDAKPAVVALAQRQPFISLSDICIEVKRIRGKRFEGINPEQLGAGVNGDDIDAYLDKVRADRKAIGDGEADVVLAIEAT